MFYCVISFFCFLPANPIDDGFVPGPEGDQAMSFSDDSDL